MTLAVARYVQTATTRSDATNYTLNSTLQAYYNTARKPSPLVVHTTSGTPLVSSFQLKAAGTWLILANGQLAAGSSSIAICRAGIAASNVMAKSGAVANPNVGLLRELSYNDTIQIALTTPGTTGAMTQAADDLNWVSFAYLGPL